MYRDPSDLIREMGTNEATKDMATHSHSLFLGMAQIQATNCYDASHPIKQKLCWISRSAMFSSSSKDLKMKPGLLLKTHRESFFLAKKCL